MRLIYTFWFQKSLHKNVKNNNSNNLKKSRVQKNPGRLTLPNRRPTSSRDPVRQRQAPNNTAYTSSSPCVSRRAASSILTVRRAHDLGPQSGHRNTKAGVSRPTNAHNQVRAHARPILASSLASQDRPTTTTTTTTVRAQGWYV